MSNTTDSAGSTAPNADTAPTAPTAPNAPTAPADGAWVSIDMHTPLPNTSVLPGSEQPPAPAVKLMKQMVQGAHGAIDRLAESAEPTVRQWSEGVANAEDALHAKTEKWLATGEQWTQSVRDTVRSHPLVAVVAALALGALLARASRSSDHRLDRYDSRNRSSRDPA